MNRSTCHESRGIRTAAPVRGDGELRVHVLDGPVVLESGEVLPEVRVAYRTWGRLSRGRDNAVLVCHALTGSSDLAEWWGGLLGSGRAFDPARDFIVCSSVLGGCYGTTGPTSPRPRRTVRPGVVAGPDAPYGPDFPEVTIRDMVAVQRRLLDALGVRRLACVAGGSMGGMQALEWAVGAPGYVAAAVVVCAPARHSAWSIALSEAQRAAIRADARWCGGNYTADRPPEAGLAAARMMAMCGYRSPASFRSRFDRAIAPDGGFQVERYLRHHGEKLVRRFDANTYVTLTRAMDTHDVGRGRGGWRAALGRVRAPVLVVAVPTDVLYPLDELEELASALPRGRLWTLDAEEGHDAFLIHQEALSERIVSFREEES